jgi:hypothetical protein
MNPNRGVRTRGNEKALGSKTLQVVQAPGKESPGC